MAKHSNRNSLPGAPSLRRTRAQTAKKLLNYGEVVVGQNGELRINIVNALGRRVSGIGK